MGLTHLCLLNGHLDWSGNEIALHVQILLIVLDSIIVNIMARKGEEENVNYVNKLWLHGWHT